MTLREKVLAKQNICGTHITMTDPSIAEMMGYIGFDFIWIDLEHAYISFEQLYSMINCAKAAGTATIVRVPQHDFTYTKKVMEMGVDGIIFPMIKDAKEAEEMINYTLYPPLGNRGCGPKRAVKFGLDDEPEYFRNGHTKTCRFIQIELIEKGRCRVTADVKNTSDKDLPPTSVSIRVINESGDTGKVFGAIIPELIWYEESQFVTYVWSDITDAHDIEINVEETN